MYFCVGVNTQIHTVRITLSKAMSETIDTSAADVELAVLVPEHPEAFDELMRRYEGKLLRYVHRLVCCNGHDAEDILQDAFLKAYQAITDFDPSLSFNSWMYRITHNTAISHYRRSTARPQEVQLPDDENALTQFVSDVHIPAATDRKLLQERVRRGLQSLPLKYRAPLELMYFEGKSVDEISDILQKPRGTVATLLRRGKAAFCRHSDCDSLRSS